MKLVVSGTQCLLDCVKACNACPKSWECLLWSTVKSRKKRNLIPLPARPPGYSRNPLIGVNVSHRDGGVDFKANGKTLTGGQTGWTCDQFAPLDPPGLWPMNMDSGSQKFKIILEHKNAFPPKHRRLAIGISWEVFHKCLTTSWRSLFHEIPWAPVPQLVEHHQFSTHLRYPRSFAWGLTQLKGQVHELRCWGQDSLCRLYECHARVTLAWNVGSSN